MDILICQPKVVQVAGRSRLEAKVFCSGTEHLVWFEVPERYGSCLVDDRSDAFVVGMLNWAMREGYDIVCEAPVTEELHFKLSEYVVPMLARYGHCMHPTSIKAALTATRLETVGAVGTGMSCGVDSLHVLSQHGLDSPYSKLRVSHLVLFNVGAYRDDSGQQQWQMVQAKKVAAECRLELVETNSNLSVEFPRDHHLQHTFSNAFGALALGKLWSVYFYGSSGMDLSSFSLQDNDLKDASFYDLLSLQCFSTPYLQFYSEGASKTKYQKTQDILKFSLAQKYLHVCVSDRGENCNICGKCRRQLLILDALGSLDEFKAVFDIDYYRKHRNWYLRWLLWRRFAGGPDDLVEETYQVLRPTIPVSAWLQAFTLYPMKWALGKLCNR